MLYSSVPMMKFIFTMLCYYHSTFYLTFLYMHASVYLKKCICKLTSKTELLCECFICEWILLSFLHFHIYITVENCIENVSKIEIKL